MNNLLYNARKIFLTPQFLIFVLIGITNTLSCILLSGLYSGLMGANTAFSSGYLSSLIISYFLNCFLTFKKNPCLPGFLKFFVSYMPNFAIQSVFVFIIYNLLKLHKLIAFSSAAIIGVPLTFVLMKYFAFKK
ncbi:MAG: GtrA family protein [Clostridiales bacterium]|jgi:putative flippase GtrA|nr:GtrA family protein [Clostridiales bacterium]